MTYCRHCRRDPLDDFIPAHLLFLAVFLALLLWLFSTPDSWRPAVIVCLLP